MSELKEEDMVEMGIFIQVSRLYDVMMALLYTADPEVAKELKEKHERGGLYGPEPTLNPEEM